MLVTDTVKSSPSCHLARILSNEGRLVELAMGIGSSATSSGPCDLLASGLRLSISFSAEFSLPRLVVSRLPKDKAFRLEAALSGIIQGLGRKRTKGELLSHLAEGFRTALPGIIAPQDKRQSENIGCTLTNWLAAVNTRALDLGAAIESLVPPKLESLAQRVRQDGVKVVKDQGCPRLLAVEANALSIRLNRLGIRIEPWEFFYVANKWQGRYPDGTPYVRVAFRRAIEVFAKIRGWGDLRSSEGFGRMIKGVRLGDFRNASKTFGFSLSDSVIAESYGSLGAAMEDLVMNDQDFVAFKRRGFRAWDLAERPQNYWLDSKGVPTEAALDCLEKLYEKIAKEEGVEPFASAGFAKVSKAFNVRRLRKTVVSEWGTTGSMVIKTFRDSPLFALQTLVARRPDKYGHLGSELSASSLSSPPKGTWSSKGLLTDQGRRAILEGFEVLARRRGIQGSIVPKDFKGLFEGCRRMACDVDPKVRLAARIIKVVFKGKIRGLSTQTIKGASNS